jgi:hypothetical protein
MVSKKHQWPSFGSSMCFYKLKMSIGLYRAQTTFILKCAIVTGEGFKKLMMLSMFPSLSFSNMILTIGGGFGT